MMQKIIFPLIVIATLFYLNKKGIISFRFPPLKIGYISSYSTKKFHASYLLYNSINKRDFMVTPGKPITFKYDVSVARGSLVLKVINNNKMIFEKKFTANIDAEDSITFTPKARLLIVRTTGYFTTGGCDVDIVKDS